MDTKPRKATLHKSDRRDTSASYHNNSERKLQHTEGVQEHAERLPMDSPQFSSQQKYKRWWFNLLDAMKKFFSCQCERKMNMRKGLM